MKDRNPKINLKTETKNLKINDSVLIGCPKIMDTEFIKNIQDGGFEYFDKYENMLQDINKKYFSIQTKNDVIKEEIVNNIVLKLIKKKLKKNDIQIELLTYKDNVKISSIQFYRYEYDKNVPNYEQRFECLTYINNEFFLWHLETYTNHSENALGVEKWEKYKIDTNTGKITLLETLNR